jgi:hypothetical protein
METEGLHEARKDAGGNTVLGLIPADPEDMGEN